MNNCPDTSCLVELLDPDNLDLVTQAHVKVCSECRADLALMRRIPAVVEPRLAVSQRTLMRTRAAIDALWEERFAATSTPQPAAPDRVADRRLDLLLAGALASLTTLAAVMAAGLPAGAGFGDLLAYSLALGLLAVIWESKQAPN